MDVDHIISITGIIIPSVISVISLWISTKTRSRLIASRVELGNESSNEDATHPSWKVWVSTPHGSTITRYFGVRKLIKFDEPFKSIPTISSALSLVNVKTIDQLLEQGFLTYKDIPKHENGRFESHVVTFVEQISKDGFELQVGLGMPTMIAENIINKLQKRNLQESEIHTVITSNYIKSRAINDITDDEKWLLNFHFIIGTIDVSWIAQAKVMNN